MDARVRLTTQVFRFNEVATTGVQDAFAGGGAVIASLKSASQVFKKAVAVNKTPVSKLVELNPKTKACAPYVGERVATPETNPSSFSRLDSGRFRNLKINEIWEKSHTDHVDKTGEWKVRSTPGRPSGSTDKIMVGLDRTIISK